MANEANNIYRGTMVIAYDVSVGGEENSFKLGTVVATEPNNTECFAVASCERYDENFSEYLPENVTKALTKFKAKSHCFPETILLYRNNVGQQELMNCREEQDAMQLMLQRFDGKIKLVFIAVANFANMSSVTGTFSHFYLVSPNRSHRKLNSIRIE